MRDDFQSYITACQQRANLALDNCLAPQNSPYSPNTLPLTKQLFDAMRYSVMNGGKRVRPVLLYATADALQSPSAMNNDFDLLACSLECIHSYSLAHDDLPAMDDDDLRRGHPSCHKAFDEAHAILAGDALQTMAFHCICTSTFNDQLKVQLVAELARAAGAIGMVGGQAIDLAAVDQHIDLAHLQAMHRLKTGALIRASVTLAAIASHCTSEHHDALDQYAINAGLAFQVRDDILDIEGDTNTLGKTQGADQALNKPTYPALLGMDGSKKKLQELHQAALAALELFGPPADRLRQLADFIVQRQH